jgi:uncharacterized pyridoxamine 5'-phosphate oxidase family protein
VSYLPRTQLRMSEVEIHDFLSSNKFGRLATVSASGEPHVTPLGYVYLDGAVYFESIIRSRRCRDITETGRVSFCVDDGVAAGEGYGKRRGVTLSGQCVRADDDPRVMTKVVPKLVELFGGSGPEDVIRSTHAFYRIDASRVASWDFRRIPVGADFRTGISSPAANNAEPS